MSQKSILIVEDIQEVRELLALAVERMAGFTLSGKAAQVWDAQLEITRNRPDCVLLDEVLPGESSFEFCGALAREGIAVILLTGMEHPKHAVHPEALGRIQKPDWRDFEKSCAELEDRTKQLTSKIEN